MYTWLYNEGGFPSGMACGEIRRAHPELAKKAIATAAVALKKGECYRPSSRALAAENNVYALRALGYSSYGGVKSVMLIFAKVLSAVAYGNKNTTVVRVVSFTTHIAYLAYNLAVFSVAGAVGDAVLLVSLTIGIFRLDLLPHLRKSEK